MELFLFLFCYCRGLKNVLMVNGSFSYYHTLAAQDMSQQEASCLSFMYLCVVVSQCGAEGRNICDPQILFVHIVGKFYHWKFSDLVHFVHMLISEYLSELVWKKEKVVIFWVIPVWLSDASRSYQVIKLLLSSVTTHHYEPSPVVVREVLVILQCFFTSVCWWCTETSLILVVERNSKCLCLLERVLRCFISNLQEREESISQYKKAMVWFLFIFFFLTWRDILKSASK